jgi:hypothetical protein
MGEEERPKTAYELAMERLARKDREAGATSRPLDDAQKAAIAEARQVYQSRVAEREILHQDALRKAKSHEELAQLNEALRRDLDRLATDRDRKIAQIRGDKPPAEAAQAE